LLRDRPPALQQLRIDRRLRRRDAGDENETRRSRQKRESEHERI
jgi:hypothetical protein